MAVKINGAVIPEEAIEFELSRLVRFYAEHMDEAQIRSQIGALKAKAIEQAIGAKLLLIEASKMDLPVSEDEIDKSLNTMIQSTGGDAAFKKAIEEQGLDEAEIRENIKEGRRVDHLVEKITAGISDPTEDEMKEHFEGHKAEYMKPERAQGQHILIKPETDSDDHKEAAWKKIEEIRGEIEGGKEFADMAKEHSACPSGESAGGSLGWFTRGMMVPEFDNAVFSMEIGALSEIIETQFGYHVILKTGHEEGEEAVFDDVRDNIREFLRHVKRGEVLSAYVNDLREKAEIEIDE